MSTDNRYRVLVGLILAVFLLAVSIFDLQLTFNLRLTLVDFSPSQQPSDSLNVSVDVNASTLPLCAVYFESISEEYMIHKGEWIDKSDSNCSSYLASTPSAYSTDSFGTGIDITQSRPLPASVQSVYAVLLQWAQSFLANASSNVTEYYPVSNSTHHIAEPETICVGRLLYDEIKRLYSVYTIKDTCIYKIFTRNESESCLSNRKIWVLHESIGRDLFYFLVESIDQNAAELFPDAEAEKSSGFYSNKRLNLTMDFDKLSDFSMTNEDHRQFRALTAFEDPEVVQKIGQRIKHDNYTEIIFGSILHDAVNANWYKTYTLDIYYSMVRKSLVNLCGIFVTQNSTDFRLWIFIGITPPVSESRFGWLGLMYPHYVRTFLHALNDFIAEYPAFKRNIVLMDTVHVSQGHLLDHEYTDDTHYGKTAKMHYANASTVVNDMAGHIVLNYLCSSHE